MSESKYMESVKYLTDEEIIHMLRKIGIRKKSELDIALAQYKEYWKTVYLARASSNNNRGSYVMTMGSRD